MAPSISSLSLVGTTLTVGGTGFTTKATPAPIIFDTVESGSFSPSWGSVNSLTVNSDNNRHAGSTKNGYLNFRAGVDEGQFKGPDPVHPKWFVSYWFKLGSNWDWGTTDFSGNNKFLSNIKIFRMYHPAGAATENYVVAYNGWENQLVADLENGGVFDRTPFFPNFRAAITLDTWHNFQFMYGEASGLGVTDGFVQMWHNGSTPGSLATRTRIVEDVDKRPFIIGFENVWGFSDGAISDPSDDAPNDFYIDDIYMDNSWARLEIGDNSVYNSCTHREMQTASAWSTTSITAALNRGSFAAGATIYLFVVDTAGVVSSGFPVPSATAAATGTFQIGPNRTWRKVAGDNRLRFKRTA